MLVLEKEVFPRFHIGESLLPIDLPIFERLGVDARLQGSFLRKDGAEFIDERTGATATFVFREGLNGTPKNAYQVERSRFDHHLMQQAEARGAKVRYGVQGRGHDRRGRPRPRRHERRGRSGRAT